MMFYSVNWAFFVTVSHVVFMGMKVPVVAVHQVLGINTAPRMIIFTRGKHAVMLSGSMTPTASDA